MDDPYPKLLQKVCHEIASKPDLVVELHSLIQHLSSESRPQNEILTRNRNRSEDVSTGDSVSTSTWQTNTNGASQSSWPNVALQSPIGSHRSPPSDPNESASTRSAAASGARALRYSAVRLPEGDGEVSFASQLHLAKEKISLLQTALEAERENRREEKRAFKVALEEIHRTHQLELAARRFDKIAHASEASLKPLQPAFPSAASEPKKTIRSLRSVGASTTSVSSGRVGCNEHILPTYKSITPSFDVGSSRSASSSPQEITHHFSNAASSSAAVEPSSFSIPFPLTIPNAGRGVIPTAQSGESVALRRKEVTSGSAVPKNVARGTTSSNSYTEESNYWQRSEFSREAAPVDPPEKFMDSRRRIHTEPSSSYAVPSCGENVLHCETLNSHTGSERNNLHSSGSTSTTIEIHYPTSNHRSHGPTTERNSEVMGNISQTLLTSSISPTPTAPIATHNVEFTTDAGRKRKRRLTPQSPALTYADKIHAASAQIETSSKTPLKSGGNLPPSFSSSSSPTNTSRREGDGGEITSTRIPVVPEALVLSSSRKEMEFLVPPSTAEGTLQMADAREGRMSRVYDGGRGTHDAGYEASSHGASQSRRAEVTRVVACLPSTESENPRKELNSFGVLEDSSYTRSSPRNVVTSSSFPSPSTINYPPDRKISNTTRAVQEKIVHPVVSDSQYNPSIAFSTGGAAGNLTGETYGEKRDLRGKEEDSRGTIPSKDNRSKSFPGTVSDNNHPHSGPLTQSPSPRNPQHGPAQIRRFVFTGLSGEEIQKLEDAITFINDDASVLQCEYDAPPPYAVTHIVCRGKPRSVKAMCGLVAGRWLVEPSYILHSLAAGFWLDEVEEGAYRLYLPPLKGIRFLLTQPDPILREKLAQVIEYGEGIVVKNNNISSLSRDSVTTTAASTASSSCQERHKKGEENGGAVVIFSGDDLLQFAIE